MNIERVDLLNPRKADLSKLELNSLFEKLESESDFPERAIKFFSLAFGVRSRRILRTIREKDSRNYVGKKIVVHWSQASIYSTTEPGLPVSNASQIYGSNLEIGQSFEERGRRYIVIKNNIRDGPKNKYECLFLAATYDALRELEFNNSAT